MRKIIAALGTLGTLAGLAATITAESGLVVTNSEALANEVFTAEAGAVIRLAGPDASRPGLLVRKGEDIEGVYQLQTTHDPFNGKAWGARTEIEYDVAQTANAPKGTWVYQGRWHAPTTGAYSFMSAFGDRCALLVDGRPVVANDWSTPAMKQDVQLAAGWHDVEIAFANIDGALGVLPGYAKGLVWSADNLAFTKENCGEGSLFSDPGDGSVLQQVHNGTFCRKLDIPSGTATLDMTASGLAGPYCFAGRCGLRTGPGAQFVVRGTDTLVWRGVDEGSVHFPLLDADVAFEDHPDGRVVVLGKASIRTLRDNYEIAEGSEVAYWGTNMITGAEWTLTNRNAQLISTSAVAPETRIVVADGRLLTLKPCEVHPDNPWAWRGIAGVYPNDIVLDGPDAQLFVRGYRNLRLTGRISGSGAIYSNDAPKDDAAVLAGDLSDFTGDIRICGDTALAVNGALPADGLRKICLGYSNMNGGGRVFFKPAGATETQTVVAVERIWGCQETAWIEGLANQEIGIGTFAGTGAVKTANLTDSHVTIDSLDPDATLVLRYTANVTVNAFGTGSKVRVIGNVALPGRFELGESADRLDELQLVDGAVVTLAGTGVVTRVTGAGTVVLGAGVTVDNVGPDVFVSTAEGRVVKDTDAAALASALGSRPALWLDAARPDTMQQYLNCVFTNGMVIRRWNDCRADQTALYGVNPRGEGYVRVYPYVMTNALNGLDVVSLGKVGGQLADLGQAYGHVNVQTGEAAGAPGTAQPETRRMPFNRPVRVRMAIVVFGSQLGGGGAILGGDTDQGVKDQTAAEKAEWVKPETACRFKRAGSTADWSKPETPIFATYRNTWVDGVAVDPTKTGYSGGWQVVSFESETEDGEEVRSLGMIDTYANSGGMNYAEVLLYTEKLTDAERRAVELHLARKWGLASGSRPMNGAGRLEVADIFPAEGSYAGAVDLAAGACLDLRAAKAPPTEADMPSDGRIGWFDPDFADAVELGGAGEAGKENCVYGIFDRGRDRVAGVPYLHGTYNRSSPAGSAGDRRPRAVREARGSGPERTWVHFFEDPPDGGGNTLRVKTNPALLRQNNPPDYTNTTLDMRTAFIVSDSVHGGGNPISDTVSVNNLVRRRQVSDSTAPIWPKDTVASVTGGVTRLNGLPVDGGKTGFTGAPEVFSFTTTKAFPAAYFGSCGNGAGERSYEMLGEIVLFDRELVGAEREHVEVYLMNKWLGRLPGGWCDWHRATVSGAGTVRAAAQATLPSFDAAFAGTLDFDGGLAFHVDAAGAVTDALTLPETATLKLPSAGEVSVTFADAPASCTLAKAGTVTGFDAANWTVRVTPETAVVHRLECAGGELRFVVVPSSTTILIR